MNAMVSALDMELDARSKAESEWFQHYNRSWYKELSDELEARKIAMDEGLLDLVMGSCSENNQWLTPEEFADKYEEWSAAENFK